MEQAYRKEITFTNLGAMAKAINPKPPKMTKKALQEEKPLKVNMSPDELLKLALNTPIKKKAR